MFQIIVPIHKKRREEGEGKGLKIEPLWLMIKGHNPKGRRCD